MTETCGEAASEWEPTVQLRWNNAGELEQRWERDIYQPYLVSAEGVVEVKETQESWRPVPHQ